MRAVRPGGRNDSGVEGVELVVMATKVALITGANKGIGLETARQLGQNGVHVIVGARDAARGEAAVAQLLSEGLSAEFLRVDLADAGTFGLAADAIAERHGRLDILVNNAAVMEDERGAATSAVGMDVWRRTFEINLFAQIELTNALLPLIRKSEAGRIVNLTSILGSIGLHATPGSPIYSSKVPAYDVSKSAVNAWTVHLAYELKDTAIKVNAAHPGWVKTDMGGEEAPMELVDGAKTSVQLALLDADGPTGGFLHMGEALPW